MEWDYGGSGYIFVGFIFGFKSWVLRWLEKMMEANNFLFIYFFEMGEGLHWVAV